VPNKKYYQYKILETLALAAANSNTMLRTYIVCPGFIYGYGEDFFFDYFKMAWIQKPKRLPIIGDGNNLIPTIHIADLANVIKRIVDKKPLIRYIFAVDRTKNKSLTSIITAISKCAGNGLVEHIEYSNVIEVPCYNELTINLDLKPSEIFDDKKEEYEDREDFERRKFKWQCEVSSFLKLVWY
jgi:adenylate kinase